VFGAFTLFTPDIPPKRFTIMSSFNKPKALKAALKMALYGSAGAGKTFTSLRISEGLAQHTGKRIAFIDTENGTAFYSQNVPQRRVHPEAFDFDVLYTKSITEVIAAVKGLDPAAHGVLVIDSISHLWDACKNAYNGKLTKVGTVPLQGWTTIKRPYKELLHFLLASPVHVIICGRQSNDFAEDEASGELKNIGFKMRAEGETAYEPDVLIRMESHKTSRKETAVPLAHVEKDRTGILAGQSIPWPAFDNLARPLLGLLGPTQAVLPTDDEVSQQDADALHRQEQQQMEQSMELAAEYTARFAQADAIGALERLGKELTPEVKSRLSAKDLARVRRAYATRLGQLKAEDTVAHATNGCVEGANT
jgi:AAA domain